MATTETLGFDFQDWRVKQVVAIDWYDGANEGFCWLEQPPLEFYFKAVGFRFCTDDVDDRVYLAGKIPSGSCSQLLEALKGLGSPTSKIWCPIWQHPDSVYLKTLDDRIDSLIRHAETPELVIYSKDMLRVLGCWRIDDETETTEKVNDWFSYLGI
ncbi:MAG: hypothetical protein DWQ35_00525 [Planctomycetota bacterium]|nr:MAG: hypothetical protein DWQ35_00525 [Planctomycetota bacterium]REK29822.1 MAG: hypothetical protein DWQ42_02650 [Planctomycetota bacterium]REK48007.1 MAG: hypothetical protein DWQ46_03705 [Planctomycetota bacterium]